MKHFNSTKTLCGVLFALLILNACTKAETQAKDSKATDPNAPSTAQCSKDTDCKADRICDKGVCTAPNTAKVVSSSTAPSDINTTATASVKAMQKEVDKNYAEIEHGDLKSFKPYAGKWYLVESNSQGRNAINVVTPDNTQAIAGLKSKCKQEFAYTFTPINGKAIQENIGEAIKSGRSYIDTLDNITRAQAWAMEENLGEARTFGEKFNPKKEYWSHVYRCGDGSRETYYLSPTQAITMEYAGDETQIYKTVR